jgi:hypothetical protein
MYTFVNKQYVSVSGVIQALIAGLIGAGIAGFLLFWISHLLQFSLIVVFPAVAAAVAGIILSFGIKSGKVKHTIAAAVLSLFTALALFAVEHYNKYQVEFVAEIRSLLEEESSAETITNTMIAQASDLVLRESTGSTGFLGYLKLESSLTSSVSSARRLSSRGVSASEGVLMVLEIIVMGVVVFLIGTSGSKDPFDEVTGEWYGEPEPLMALAANARVPDRQQYLTALNRADFLEAQKYATNPDLLTERQMVMLRRTSNKITALIEIYDVTYDEKGQEKRKLERQALVKWQAIQPFLDWLEQEHTKAQPPIPEAQPNAKVLPTPAFVPSPIMPAKAVAPFPEQPTIGQTTSSGIKLGR